MTNEIKPTPVEHFRIGRLCAAIWKNTNDKGEHFYNFTIDRVYEKDGKLESTNSFGLSNALVLAKLCSLVDTRIRRYYAADRKADQIELSLGA